MKHMMNWNNQLLRTLLFAPGNQPRKLAKVGSFGADAVVFDLEDAVPVSEKTAARGMVADALQVERASVVCVRVNAVQSDLWRDDLAVVIAPTLDGLLLPKVESVVALADVDAEIARYEAECGLETGTIRLFPLIETARGLRDAEDIAEQAPARVQTLILGQIDLAADLQIDLVNEPTQMLYARSRVVVAARAAGLSAPIYGPFMALTDDEGLRRDTQMLHELGYGGRIAIYPPQVATIHAVFSSATPEEIAAAERVITAYEAALAEGLAAIQVDGRFVDEPVYQRAQQKLRLHRASVTENEAKITRNIDEE
jgi:citrate lyase subunit beta/citryl-CoA lyase